MPSESIPQEGIFTVHTCPSCDEPNMVKGEGLGVICHHCAEPFLTEDLKEEDLSITNELGILHLKHEPTGLVVSASTEDQSVSKAKKELIRKMRQRFKDYKNNVKAAPGEEWPLRVQDNKAFQCALKICKKINELTHDCTVSYAAGVLLVPHTDTRSEVAIRFMGSIVWSATEENSGSGNYDWEEEYDYIIHQLRHQKDCLDEVLETVS